jgi:hypothetical protein
VLFDYHRAFTFHAVNSNFKVGCCRVFCGDWCRACFRGSGGR